MDRVMPFQRVDREHVKLHQLRELEHESGDDRTSIHSAASAVATFAAKNEQKQLEFRKQFSKAVSKAKENTKTDDYQLFIRKKWEAMRQEHLLDELFGETESELPEEEASVQPKQID